MKRVLMMAVALLPLMLMAQAKIGIVNSQQIFDLMPEKAAAEAQLKALSDKYHAEYELLRGEFDKKYADYQTVAADASMPETIKERRVQEAQLKIKQRFGKNAILRGVNFEEGATARERNKQIGGHKA